MNAKIEVNVVVMQFQHVSKHNGLKTIKAQTKLFANVVSDFIFWSNLSLNVF